jgi:hypothetical protein
MNSGGEKYAFFYMPLFTLTIGECIRHSNGGFSIIIYYESVCRFWGLDGLEAGRCNMQSINQSPFRSCKNSRGRGREKNSQFLSTYAMPAAFCWLVDWPYISGYTPSQWQEALPHDLHTPRTCRPLMANLCMTDYRAIAWAYTFKNSPA